MVSRGMDSSIVFQPAATAPPSPSKRGTSGFEVGKRGCAMKVSGLEPPAGCAGGFPSRNAVLVAPMFLFGNRFCAAVCPWPSRPARRQVAMRC